jgi:hypothetical protein
MKTSKIIFFSLLTTIALFILAAIVDVRLTGKKGNEPSNLNTQEIPVGTFSVVVINNCSNISVRPGASPKLKVSSKNAFEINYKVSADTLTISDANRSNNNNDPIFFTIEFTSLKKLIASNSSSIYFNVTDLAEVEFDAVNSNVYINASPGKDKPGVIRITGRNHSMITSSDIKTGNLEIVLERSEANLMITAESINGNVYDESRLTILQPADLSMKSDSTSFLSITRNYKNDRITAEH